MEHSLRDFTHTWQSALKLLNIIKMGNNNNLISYAFSFGDHPLVLAKLYRILNIHQQSQQTGLNGAVFVPFSFHARFLKDMMG